MTVAEPPDVVRLPLHTWLSVTPVGSVHFTVQPATAAEPALTVTVAWKPPCQELTIEVLALQAPEAEVIVLGEALDGDALDGDALDGGALDGPLLDGEAVVGPVVGLAVDPPLVV